jgi:hypothetical protein
MDIALSSPWLHAARRFSRNAASSLGTDFGRTERTMRSSSQRACACGRHYDTKRWAALHLFARLTVEEVSAVVTPWPPHLVVEVRVCAGCERPISRLTDAALEVSVTGQEPIAA